MEKPKTGKYKTNTELKWKSCHSTDTQTPHKHSLKSPKTKMFYEKKRKKLNKK